jgi:serine/threonine protein kinase
MLEASERADTRSTMPSDACRGRRSGAAGAGFSIQRRIGRGGSATVPADQERADSPARWRSRSSTGSSTRNRPPLRDEQRILAQLEHPGIARLYDAGVTANGRPYLAVALVEGETLLEHCRARHLPVRQRLELS